MGKKGKCGRNKESRTITNNHDITRIEKVTKEKYGMAKIGKKI